MKETMYGGLIMVSYDVIKQVGYKLRQTDIKTISTPSLFQLLRKATNTHLDSTIRHYVKILKNEKFIRFNNQGTWDIIR